MNQAIELHDKENSPEATFILKNLTQFNESQGFVANLKPLTAVIKNTKGEIIAGLSGNTSWQWLYTRLLWVSESERRKSYGSDLLMAAEKEAKKRGCLHAYIDTFSEQTKIFYEKNGYKIFGELKDFPPGNTRFFLQKKL